MLPVEGTSGPAFEKRDPKEKYQPCPQRTAHSAEPPTKPTAARVHFNPLNCHGRGRAELPLLETISRFPSVRQCAVPLVFVHGSGLAAWAWDQNVLPLLVDRGVEVHAISLRGCGSSEGAQRLWHTGLATHVWDLRRAVQRLRVHEPVMVGQSIGSTIVQRYLEIEPVSGGFLLAPIPPHGALRATSRYFLRHPFVSLNAISSRSLTPLVATADLSREFLFAPSTSFKEVFEAAPKLGDGPFAAHLRSLLPLRLHPGRVQAPVRVMGGSDDQVIQTKELYSTAALYDVDPEIVSGVAHDMMLCGNWLGVVEKMIDWLHELGLYGG